MTRRGWKQHPASGTKNRHFPIHAQFHVDPIPSFP
jgi:hypothetical protein